MILSDIANSGTYLIDGQKIQISFVTSGDAGSTMTFTLASDRQSIVNDGDHTSWALTK